MKEPSIGKIVRIGIEETALTEVLPKVMEYQRFDGKYITFKLSTSFVLKNHQDSFEEEGVFLENAFFVETYLNSKKLALTVEDISGRSITESANYNLRIKNSKKYQKERKQIGDVSATVFFLKEKDLYEKVFFLEKNNLLVQISLTASDFQRENLDEELLDIVQSLQWKNSE